MLTITEIKNKKFEKSAFGYKVEDVESFLNEIIDCISTLENEKVETEKKLVVLANKIEEYRNEEDSLRQALLGAQKLGDSILKEAKNRAEIMMRDATIKSENIVKNVKEDVKREEVILNKMKREVDSFRSKMLTMYHSQIDMIKSLPEIERAEAEKVTAEPEEAIAEPAVEAVSEPKKEEVVIEEVTPPAPEVQEEIHSASEEEASAPQKEPEQEDTFKISGGFKFSRFDEKENKTQSKFGPLKFGDGYDLNDDAKK